MGKTLRRLQAFGQLQIDEIKCQGKLFPGQFPDVSDVTELPENAVMRVTSEKDFCSGQNGGSGSEADVRRRIDKVTLRRQNVQLKYVGFCLVDVCFSISISCFYSPNASECGRGQPRFQENVPDFWSGHQAVHVPVRLAEELIVLGLFCWCHHPLSTQEKKVFMLQQQLDASAAHITVPPLTCTSLGLL